MTIPKGSGVKRETEVYNHDADLLCSVSSIDLRYCDAALKCRHLTSMCTVHSFEKFLRWAGEQESHRTRSPMATHPRWV